MSIEDDYKKRIIHLDREFREDDTPDDLYLMGDSQIEGAGKMVPKAIVVKGKAALATSLAAVEFTNENVGSYPVGTLGVFKGRLCRKRESNSGELPFVFISVEDLLSNLSDRIAILADKDVVLSESEYKALEESGEVDPEKTYNIYEDES